MKQNMKTIDPDIKRLEQTLQFHHQNIEDAKKHTDREIEHVEDRFNGLYDGLYKAIEKATADVKAIPKHQCSSVERIGDIQESTMENAKSINRIYKWQAGIGISLLITFLTMGVASVRYVDTLDFAQQRTTEQSQRNTEQIQILKSKLEKSDEDKDYKLRKEIRDALYQFDR